MKKIVFPEPQHEKAIEIMERAKKELEVLGYTMQFTKTFQAEELLPAYSSAYFQMKLSAMQYISGQPIENNRAMQDW